jgi:hypothetical protein
MTKPAHPIRAWHFVRADRRLGYDRCNHIVQVGETLTHDGKLLMRLQGLHACRRPIDALDYAPGPIACLVELSGEVLEGADKMVASKRTVLDMVDATKVLRTWARECVSDVIKLWDAPPQVLHFLETGEDPSEVWALAQASLQESTEACGASVYALDTVKRAVREAARAEVEEDLDSACWYVGCATRQASKAEVWASKLPLMENWKEYRAKVWERQNARLEAMLLEAIEHT